MRLLIPNSTQVPNFLLDKLLPVVGFGEWKVISFVCRKTLGWHKREDRISLSQFELGTGLSRPSVVKILTKLVETGLLLKTSNTVGNIYALNLEYADTSELSSPAEPLNHLNQLSQLTKTGELSLEDGELSLPTKQTNTKPRNLKPSRSDERGPDPRHQQIREHIQKIHSEANGMRLEVVPWDSAEGSALKKFLAANPMLMVEEALRCVGHYYQSDLNISERPRKWIPKMMEYWSGPLDQYGRPRWTNKEYARESRMRMEANVGRH